MGNAKSTREIKRTAKYSFPGGVVDDDDAESDEGGVGDDSNDDNENGDTKRPPFLSKLYILVRSKPFYPPPLPMRTRL